MPGIGDRRRGNKADVGRARSERPQSRCSRLLRRTVIATWVSLCLAAGQARSAAGEGGGGGLSAALLEKSCIVEGAPQAVRLVLELEATGAAPPESAARRLADLPEESAGRRLLAASGSGSPVSLVYLAPGDGCDLA